MDPSSSFPEDEQICIQATTGDVYIIAGGSIFGQQVTAQLSTGKNTTGKKAADDVQGISFIHPIVRVHPSRVYRAALEWKSLSIEPLWLLTK